MVLRTITTDIRSSRIGLPPVLRHTIMSIMMFIGATAPWQVDVDGFAARLRNENSFGHHRRSRIRSNSSTTTGTATRRSAKWA